MSTLPDQKLPAFVEFCDVNKAFDGVHALWNFNLRVRRGEIFALLGPSGCGKSTLLRILAGLEQATSGTISIEGERMDGLAPWDRPVNMMFQSYALFPHMSVEQNIAFGLKQEKLPADIIATRVSDALALVQMEQYRRRKPEQLSGGQQQRVALARSLVKQPKVLLLDEPMAALDRKLRARMQFELAEIIRQVRVTCIMVTHDQEEAMVMADRMALMNDGRIVQIGTPAEVYELPNSQFSAEFLGGINMFPATVISSGDGLVVAECDVIGKSLKVFCDASAAAGDDITVAVRPENLVLSTGELDEHHNTTRVVVEDVAYMGSQTAYHVRSPSGRMITVIEPTRHRKASFEHGTPVSLGWNIRDGVLLTA